MTDIKTKKKRHIVRRILIGIVSLVIVIFAALYIYSSNPYEPLPEMFEAINDMESIQVETDISSRYIKYTVSQPLKNIIFVPGGLVRAESYQYLAYNLAKLGYNVTIVKPFFNLAILSPNLPGKFIDENLDNVIIGHSLGGVVASMVAHNNESISKVILLGSYPTTDLKEKEVLIITAENDLVMDRDNYIESFQYLTNQAEILEIDGGNHAGFGWYGEQKGDGEATISILDQQLFIIASIDNFIQ